MFLRSRRLALVFAAATLLLAVFAPTPVRADDDNIVQENTRLKLVDLLQKNISRFQAMLKAACEALGRNRNIADGTAKYEDIAESHDEKLAKIRDALGNDFFGKDPVKTLTRRLAEYTKPTVANLQKAEDWRADVEQKMKDLELALKDRVGKQKEHMEAVRKRAKDDVLDEDEVLQATERLDQLRLEANDEIDKVRFRINDADGLAGEFRSDGPPGQQTADAVRACERTMHEALEALTDRYDDLLEWEDGEPGAELRRLLADSADEYRQSLYELRRVIKKYEFKPQFETYRDAMRARVARYVALIREEVKSDNPDAFEERHDLYKEWFNDADEFIERLQQTRQTWLQEAAEAVTEAFANSRRLIRDDKDKEEINRLEEQWGDDRDRFNRDIESLQNDLRTQHDWNYWDPSETWEDKLGSETGWAASLNIKANLLMELATRARKYNSLWNTFKNELANLGGLAFAAGKIIEGTSLGEFAKAVGFATIYEKFKTEYNAYADFTKISLDAAGKGYLMTWTEGPTIEGVMDALSNLTRYVSGDYMRAYERSALAIYNTAKRLGNAAVDLGLAGEDAQNEKAIADAAERLLKNSVEGPFDDLSWDFNDLDDARSKTTPEQWAAEWRKELSSSQSLIASELSKLPSDVRDDFQKFLDNADETLEDTCELIDQRWDSFVEDVEEKLLDD